MSTFSEVYKPSRIPAHERHVVRAPRRRAFVPPPVPFLDEVIEGQIAACRLKIPPTLTNVISKTFVELKASAEDCPVRQRSSSPLLDQALLRSAPLEPKAPLTNLVLLKSEAAKRVVKHERDLINARGYKDELERWVAYHTDSVTQVLQELSYSEMERGRDNLDHSTDLPKVDGEPTAMESDLPVSTTAELAKTDIKLPPLVSSPLPPLASSSLPPLDSLTLSTDRSCDTVYLPITETPVSDNSVPAIDLSFLKTPPATYRVITPPLSTGSPVTAKHSDSPGWFDFPKIDNSPLTSRQVGPVPPLDLSFLITPPSGGKDVKDKLQDLSSFLQQANKKQTEVDLEIKAEEQFWANQSLQDLGNFLQQEKTKNEAEITKKELVAEGQYWANQSLQDLGNFLKAEKAKSELIAEEQFWANKSLQDLGNYLKQEKAKKEAEIAKKEMEFFKPEKLVKVEKPLKEVRSLPSQLAKPVPQYTSEHISRNFPTVHQEFSMMWKNPAEPMVVPSATASKLKAEKPAKNIFLNPNTTTKKETPQPKCALRRILKNNEKDAGNSKKSRNEHYDPYAKPLVPIVEGNVGQNGKPILKIPTPPTTKKPANKRMARHRKFKAPVVASN